VGERAFARLAITRSNGVLSAAHLFIIVRSEATANRPPGKLASDWGVLSEPKSLQDGTTSAESAATTNELIVATFPPAG